MPDNPYEPVYAIVIIFVILLFSVTACVGLRVFRKTRFLEQQRQQQQEEEGQPVNDIQLVRIAEAADDEAIKTVTNWQQKYPPNTTQFIDVKNDPMIIEKGVLAWKFVEADMTQDSEYESNAAIMDDPYTIVFCQGQGSIMTNLPVPMQELSYWEVKVLQLHEEDSVAIGFATKPYPRWRLPGWHKHSVAYHSNSGAVFVSDSTYGRPYGPPIKEGDVVGVGYLYQSGTIFFTQNGKNLGKALIGFKYPIFPIIGASGPCHVSVNFGLQEFLYVPANQREAAFAPKQGLLPPPPAYGGHIDDTILSDDNSHNENHLTYTAISSSSPPGYSS
ncbi:SPRY-domain-containing protein [Rhizopus microsporus var. microsporus]|uniref:SPRY-domain-containing protein n=1 Tax=Rhizopus microsporus var. microsporus TaxID=86635 RepID=A0A1X0QQR1_RHIZD|nr:SPRY-domain-containing protein [Rhizopus microsporus var. microsporus]